jgi:hypothetical protein
MLVPRGATCLLAASVVLCTSDHRSDAHRSNWTISFHDYVAEEFREEEAEGTKQDRISEQRND